MNLLGYCYTMKKELGTWKEVAAFLGLPGSSFSLLLNGQRKPSLEMMLRIREKSGGKVADVLDFVVKSRSARGR